MNEEKYIVNEERYECLKCGHINPLDKFEDTECDGDVIGTCPNCSTNTVIIPYTVNKLDYNYVAPHELPHDKATFRISASQISNFFDYTNSWYRQNLLGEQGFRGNTASVSGTCVHYLAEQFANNNAISPEDREEIYSYIAQEASEDVDADMVRSNIKPMWSALKDYLIDNPVSLCEPLVTVEVLPGITVGGSIDGLIDLTEPGAKYATFADLVASGHEFKISDYKTTSAKSPVAKFSKGYSWQLLVYAFVLKELGVRVTQIELVYITKEHIGEVSPKTGKQLKSYPSQVYTLVDAVVEDDLKFIKSLIDVVAHSVRAFVTQPELRFLLAQDMRLKDHTTALPFTNIGKTVEEDL